MKPTVGLIGLGLMGKPMGRNLLKAGFPLVVWNRTAARAEELVSEGAKLAANPRETAAAADVLISDRERSAGTGRSAVGRTGRDGRVCGAEAIYMDSSTISPELARRVAAACGERGVDFLDAPVTGGDWGAKKGELVFMIGGKAEVLERAKPVLEVLGKKFFLLGPNGAGQTVKLAMNLILALEVEALAEALALATSARRRGREAGGGNAIEHGARGGAGCEGAANAEERIRGEFSVAADA